MTDEEYTAFLEENKATTEYQEVEKPEPRKKMSIIDTLIGAAKGDFDNTSEDSALDKIKYNYNKELVQPTRELMGSENEQATPWYQPKTVVKDGKTYATKNKTFNDMTPAELAYAKYELAKEKSDDPKNDPYVYELSRKVQLAEGEANLFKPGLAAEGAPERYKENALFGNWKMDKNVQTKNATKIEKLMQGNLPQLEKRMYDYASSAGKNGQNPLGESRTEIYSGKADGTQPTTIQRESSARVDKINANNPYTKVAEKIREKSVHEKQIETFNKLKPIQASDLTGLSMGDALKKMREKDEARGGSMSNTGSMSDTELYKTSQFSKLVNDLSPDFSDMEDMKDATQEQKNRKFGEMMSTFDWNLYAKGRVAFAKKNPKMAKALDYAREMYRTTNTSSNQIASGMKGVATDPTNFLGIGLLSKFFKVGSKITPTIGAAAEGMGYGGIDNAFDQKIKMDADDKRDFDFTESLISIGAGGLIGGSIGKLLSGTPKKELEVAQARLDSAKTPEEKKIVAQEITKEFREKGYLETYSDNVKKNAKEFNKPEGKDVVEETITTTTKEAPSEKVKPTESDTIIDKKGNPQKGEEYSASVKNIEREKLKIHDARKEPGESLPDQPKSSAKENPKTIKVEPDNRGRAYEKDGSLLSLGGTKDQKAKIEPLPKRKMDSTKNVTEELNEIRSIETNRNLKQKAYGAEQSSYKGEGKVKNISEKQVEANVQKKQVDFLKNELSTNKDLTPEVKKFIRKEIARINKETPTQFPISKNKRKVAEKAVAKSKLGRTRNNPSRVEYNQKNIELEDHINKTDPGKFKSSPFGKLSTKEQEVAGRELKMTMRKKV